MAGLKAYIPFRTCLSTALRARTVDLMMGASVPNINFRV